jgi:hypothetical protein
MVKDRLYGALKAAFSAIFHLGVAEVVMTA